MHIFPIPFLFFLTLLQTYILFLCSRRKQESCVTAIGYLLAINSAVSVKTQRDFGA